MEARLNGVIIKALSGFYYVASEDGVITCRARGLFRKTGQTPLVGDRVEFLRAGAEGLIEALLPRKNAFLRPAVANVDALVIFASEAIPVTEPFLIDRMTVLAARQGAASILCVNKTDLSPAERLTQIYRAAGFPVVCTSAKTGAGIDELRSVIRGKTVVFTGNSGVGKSAVLQRLCPDAAIETGEISAKLGRGRHTTRHIAFFDLGNETYVADTPGFASFEPEETARIPKQELQALFPDFAPYRSGCRFPDCSHRTEPGCVLLQALRDGKIEATRHESYRRLFAASEQVKDWERKQL